MSTREELVSDPLAEYFRHKDEIAAYQANLPAAELMEQDQTEAELHSAGQSPAIPRRYWSVSDNYRAVQDRLTLRDLLVFPAGGDASCVGQQPDDRGRWSNSLPMSKCLRLWKILSLSPRPVLVTNMSDPRQARRFFTRNPALVQEAERRLQRERELPASGRL